MTKVCPVCKQALDNRRRKCGSLVERGQFVRMGTVMAITGWKASYVRKLVALGTLRRHAGLGWHNRKSGYGFYEVAQVRALMNDERGNG